MSRCGCVGGLAAADRGHVLFQSDAKGGRRGEQAFLEQLEDELGGHALAIGGGLLEPQLGILLQGLVGLTLFVGIGHFQVLDHPLGKAPAAIPAQLEFGLHAPNHDGFQLVAVRRHGTGETLVVEQFQQGGEALPVAVVRAWRKGTACARNAAPSERMAKVRMESVAYLPRPEGATLCASSTIIRS